MQNPSFLPYHLKIKYLSFSLRVITQLLNFFSSPPFTTSYTHAAYKTLPSFRPSFLNTFKNRTSASTSNTLRFVTTMYTHTSFSISSTLLYNSLFRFLTCLYFHVLFYELFYFSSIFSHPLIISSLSFPQLQTLARPHNMTAHF